MERPITMHTRKALGWRAQLWKHAQARRITKLERGEMAIVGAVKRESLWHNRSSISAFKVQHVKYIKGKPVHVGPIKLLCPDSRSLDSARWHTQMVKATREYVQRAVEATAESKMIKAKQIALEQAAKVTRRIQDLDAVNAAKAKQIALEQAAKVTRRIQDLDEAKDQVMRQLNAMAWKSKMEIDLAVARVQALL